jgi:hypothetical protein
MYIFLSYLEKIHGFFKKFVGFGNIKGTKINAAYEQKIAYYDQVL